MAPPAFLARRSHGGKQSANPDDGDARGGWLRRLPFVFLGFVLLLGGGGSRYPLVETAIEWFALVVIALALHRLRGARIGRVGGAVLAVAALALLLALLQLVPLPWGWWSAMPGQAAAATVYRTLGWDGAWRPLSLTPDATRATILAQLPAWGVLLAALGWSWRERVVAMRIVVGVALVGVLIAALQVAAGPDAAPLLFETAHRAYGVGLFVNRNHQATLLLVAIVLAGVPGVVAMPGRRRRGSGGGGVIAAMVIALLAIGVLATASRTGLLLLPVAVAVAALTLLPRGRIVPLAIGGAAVAAVALYFTPLVQDALARFATVGEDDRYHYWDNTLFAAREALPWGTGFGSFRTVYTAVEPIEQITVLTVPHAHSDYLELLLEGGVPAVLLLLAGLAVLAVALIAALRARAAPDGAVRRVQATGAAAGIALILAGSVVDFPLRMSALLALLALLAALLVPPVVPVARRGGSDRGWRIALGIGVALIGWQALAQGLSQQLILGRQGAMAVRVAPWSASAWAMLAAQQPLPQGADAAVLATERALRIAPTQPIAVRVEGLAALARGDTAKGQALLRFAAQLGWRDPPTQLWLVQEAIAAGAIDFAVERADALVRQGQQAPLVYAQLDRLFTLPEGRAAIARRFADRPGWRQGFVNTLAVGAEDRVPALLDFVVRLRRAGVPSDPREAALILWRLDEAGDRAAALRLWRAVGGSGAIGDGGFDGAAGPLPPDSPPFAWHGVPGSGIQTVVGEPDVPLSGGALQVTAAAARGGVAAAQRVLPAPGRHLLRYAVQADGGTAAPGWVLVCAGGGEVAAIEDRPGSAGGWQRRVARLDVPATCGPAELQLRIAEGNRPGAFWIDAVSLTRAE
ncbi:O-antigen ligase family protein [Sphingomonas sp. VNH70]|uniref:O-antigen ligase family protein n=1 Tax=Sphingomonas silueang TaxID=3156617 RepID=UPI0032B47F2A